MKTELSKEIIFMFLSGNATPLQRKLIEEWLQEDNNLEQYYDWLEEWEEKHPQFIPDTQASFEKLKIRVAASSENASVNPYARQTPFLAQSRRRFTFWMAASLVFLLAAVLAFNSDFIRYKTYHTAYGEIKKVVLEDGTVVTLNANSWLQHSRFSFGKANREVLLKGEAEFSVTHTPDHKRFIVRTQDHLEVEVLGTEFVVFSRSRGSKVVLNKGRVQLRTAPDRQPVVISPGDVVTVNPKGAFQLQKKQVVQKYNAWKEHRFVFDRTPMHELVQLMQENFGADVRLTDSTLATRKITGTFRAENAQELLYGISQALDLSVQSRSGNFILTEN